MEPWKVSWFGFHQHRDECFKAVSAALMIHKPGLLAVEAVGVASREAAGVGADASWVGGGFHSQRVSAVDHLSSFLGHLRPPA